ncbi:NACHT domain [Seminavis robusta]|uniref:NACHT domain n=1 Tax=Seminavis robusta TaxID=568900 RepID=A0A9N8DWI9_9STRA|nr:NACHT domain [Seminavis robusta]|eukprot:Sro429_g141140.1 NACHT domain (685) ;mRNA; f:48830-50995
MRSPFLFSTISQLSWFLVLAAFPPLAQGSSKASSRTLDLSYKHYLEASQLEEAIRVCERQDTFDVDVSCSLLGDEKDFQAIVKALLPKETTASRKEPVGIKFVSRGNRLTPRAVEGIFQMLLASATNNNQTLLESNETDANTNSTDDSISQSNNTTVEDDGQKNSTTTPTNYAESIPSRPWNVHTLDVGWNRLQLDAPGWKTFLKSLQKLLQTPEVCPQNLCFERCGLSPGACRAIGKGIINRFTTENGQQSTTVAAKPLSLHLCGNPDLGDSGAAAIAAAIRTVVTSSKEERLLLDTLDLSACEIGDAGAEAIALALESCHGMCIRQLDLSHNKLTDVGAAAIAHALLGGSAMVETLDLSGNAGIKDKSAIVLAEAVEKGVITKSIRLRSCQILADGAAAFGKAMLKRSQRAMPASSTHVEIDLSGNPLGVLRGKMKKGKKYSASAIKSKATATTAAYVSMFKRGLKTGLQEFGVELGGGGNSGESDDEEEERSGMSDDSTGGDIDPEKARCGIKALANAILDDDDNIQGDQKSTGLKYSLGLRRCFLDHGAADALAAVLVHAKEEIGIDLSIDVGMNPVLEEEMTEAIEGDETQEDTLREMSDRYLDALEALREARERAIEAAKAAAARLQAEKDYESQWDVPDGFPDDPWEEDWREEEEDFEDEWDSDADYEQPYDDEEYY